MSVTRIFSLLKKVGSRTRNQLYDATVPPKQLASATSMELSAVVQKLNGFAPPSMAGSWDNVGLLVEPSSPLQVSRILLTNDLTEPVMTEAVQFGADMVFSYHPPIFSGMKRLTQNTWKERIVVKCLENRIAVYSPHTAMDALSGGVNDWLLKPFAGSSEVIQQIDSKFFSTPGGFRFEVSVPERLVANIEQQLLQIDGATLANKNQYASGDNSMVRLALNCTSKALPGVVAVADGSGVKDSAEVLALTKPPIPNHGPGRVLKLTTPLPLTEAVNKIKKHIGKGHVRLAKAVGVHAEKEPVKTIAVCAGSGSSILQGVAADLYITGEMSHHDVLDANHRGAHVILCEHSNSERGYLTELKEKLDDLLESRIELRVSDMDADPLMIV